MRWMIAGSFLLAMVPVAVAGQGVLSLGTTRAAQPVKPYTMTQRVTEEKSFGDGLVSTQTTELVGMRDAQGRNRGEHTFPQMNPTKYIRDGRVSRIDGRTDLRIFNVYDPVDRVSMSWTTGQGSQPVVSVNHMPTPEARPGVAGLARKAVEARGGEELTAESVTEKLGTRAIQGVIAEGARTTTKYSAGVSGMNREFTVINETWTAVEYHIVVESSSDDPRNGKQVVTLVSFVAGDPDPAMFKAPAGAKVIDTVQTTEKPESERALR